MFRRHLIAKYYVIFCFNGLLIFLPAEAVEQNDLIQLKELLAAQRSPKPRELTSALEIAVMKRSDDYAECIQLLLHYGANPDGHNGSGTPFLHLAADANCHQILKLLIKYKCNVNIRREDGSTAIHRAAWHGHMECLSALLDANADVSVLDSVGRTPLLVAVQRNQMKVAKVLLAMKPSLDLCDNNNRSVLYWVVFHQNTALVSDILSRGCCRVLNHHADTDGMTPLILAVHTGNANIVQMLLDAGALPDLRDSSGMTAINVAAAYDRLTCLRRLISAGCDVNVHDPEGRVPLMMLLNHPDVTELLLDAGADPNITAEHCVTSLWLATAHQFVVSVKLLLQYNARVDVPSGSDGNKLPLQIAMYGGSLPLVKMLLITSVAMAVDLRWLQDYLSNDNLRSQSALDAKVAVVIQWVSDVFDQFYRPQDPPTLKCSCRTFLRRKLGSRALFSRIESLHLPQPLKDYLKLKELDQHIADSA